ERRALEHALLSLKLGEELVERCAAMLLVGRRGDFLHELVEAHRRIHDDRLHVRDILQRVVQTDGIEDAEAFLADLWAEARGASEHLLVEDAAAHATKED